MAAGGVNLIFLALVLFNTFLPTLPLYGFLIFAFYRCTRWPSVVSLLILTAATLPFAHWAWTRAAVQAERRRERAVVSAVPTQPLPRIPSTLVWETDGAGSVEWSAVRANPQIRTVIAKGPYGTHRLMRFDVETAVKKGRLEPVEIAMLPREYLLLRVGRASAFAERHVTYAAAGRPYELRYVGDGQDNLVSLGRERFNPVPMFPPLLSVAGWFGGSNARSTMEDKAAEMFLTRALRIPSERRAAM